MALPRFSILALLLIFAVAAVFADNKAAPAGDKGAPTGSELPAVLTPFAQSPGMADSLADGPSNAIDDSDVNSAAALGSPAKAEDYGARDPDSSSAAATPVAAAVSVAAAAAGAGYMFF